MKQKIFIISFLLLGFIKTKAAAPSWSVNPASFQFNMTLVAVANINCVELANPSNRIGVFVGTQCRGTALTSQVVNGRYTASLFVYSNNVSGDSVSFQVYNAALDSVFNIPIKIVFQQNANYGTATAPFVIYNNQSPTDISTSVNSFSENTSIGATIATLSAQDPDGAENFSYSLVSGSGSTDNSKFSILGNTLRLASTVNFEIQKTCAIRLRVLDGRGCSFEKVISLNVINFNEPPTAILISDSTIFENAAALTIIGTLSAVDADSADMATFSLVGGVGSTDNASFTISGNILRATQSFNFEIKASYSIRVGVRDAANNSFERIINIVVKDANDFPTNILLNGSTIGASFAENRTIGSLLATFTTTDEDVANQFTYTFVNAVGNDNSNFQIVGNQLRSNANFDFETRQIYAIAVQTNDGNGGIFSKQFLLTVTDSNDAPIAVNISNNTILENQPLQTFIAKLSTSDPDVTQTNFTYNLVSGSGSSGNSNFTISNDTLYSNNTFNFEGVNSYSIRLRTTDAFGASFTQVFIISVLDANDNPSDVSLSNNSINENQSINTVIGTLTSTDQDIISTFSYSLVSGLGATDNSFFNISGNTLRTSSVFNFENKSTYSIRVRTTDGNGGFFEKIFAININNINDAPSDINLSNNSIAENRSINSVIGSFTSIDQDVTDNFTYSFANIAGNDNNSFIILGNTLRVAQQLNFEQKNTYFIYVTTTDASSASFTKQFQINILDSNDAPIDISISSPSISENLSVNSFIGKFSTTDQDANNSFIYSLVSGTGSADNPNFIISNDSLYCATVLNFETKNTFSIRVRSTDNGNLFTEKVFTITVINGNDAPTDISLSNNLVNENMPFNTLIGNLNSTDPDTGNVFTYALVPGVGAANNALFTIVGNQLRTFGIFNFENQKNYSIRIQTNDGNGGTFSKVFTINVVDINDRPTNILLSNNSITESKPLNSLVGNLTSADEDTLSSFVYSFSNSQTNDNNKFILSGNQLRTNASFDFETKSIYVVNIQTDDGNGGVFEKQFIINVLDSNDAPFNISISNNSINENEATNTFIGLLSAEDPDALKSFTYSLVNGIGASNNQSFIIRNDSLFSNEIFNYEAKTKYSIRVQVTDNGGLSFAKSFEVIINNQNDAPTAIVLSNSQITENSASRTFIGSFSANDEDSLNFFSYSLVAGVGAADNANFSISGVNLFSNSSFNYEVKNNYSIRVKVIDGRGKDFETNFIIAVIDSNDAPSNILLSANNVSENKNIGTLVATISTIDQDTNNTYNYSFFNGSNNDNAQFLIINNQLRTNAVFNYEKKDFYVIQIVATDNFGVSISKQFIINVIDSVDAPQNVELSNNIVSENQPINSFVGFLTSIDEDQFSGFNYVLVGGVGATNNGLFKISNDSLFTNQVFNFEAKNSYSIRIRSTDISGAFVEKVFTVDVKDENDAPSNVSLSNLLLNENNTNGILVGSFTTTDADLNDNFEYALVAGVGSSDNNLFSIVNNNLFANFVANFELKSSYLIRVQTKDLNKDSFEKSFTISIVDVNEKPQLKLDTFTVSENAPIGTMLGTCSANDVDVSSTFTYTLINTNTSLPFDVDNNGAIVLKSSLDYEANKQYTLKIVVNDGGANSLNDTGNIVIIVNDEIEVKQALPVSNYMSPNGDGDNDYFTIANVELYADYELTILNENGLEVYKVLRDYNNDWNGTYNNKQLPSGTYFYVFKNKASGAEFKGVFNIVNK